MITLVLFLPRSMTLEDLRQVVAPAYPKAGLVVNIAGPTDDGEFQVNNSCGYVGFSEVDDYWAFGGRLLEFHRAYRARHPQATVFYAAPYSDQILQIALQEIAKHVPEAHLMNDYDAVWSVADFLNAWTQVDLCSLINARPTGGMFSLYSA